MTADPADGNPTLQQHPGLDSGVSVSISVSNAVRTTLQHPSRLRAEYRRRSSKKALNLDNVLLVAHHIPPFAVIMPAAFARDLEAPLFLRTCIFPALGTSFERANVVGLGFRGAGSIDRRADIGRRG
ncbi:hypothetical protein ACTXJ8_12740 [Corynebacterium variabile]|uniref:hypothetical protein n=1 Tax=Corynebacterium variabile TaxID=1727 RepID=UPI003FCF3BA6